MRSDIYATRIAVARGTIAASVEKLAALRAFKDGPSLLAGAVNKDKDAQILFEREVYAVLFDRLAEFALKKGNSKNDEAIAELQTKVDELTAENTALLADIEAFKELARSDSPSASDVGGTDAAKP